MSKIKVDEVEANSANIKLASKGTGLVKVQGAGGDDGTLKLSAGTHGVKIKSPNHSSGQSYSLILPDNNIEANKYLKVKNVSGSGSNEVAELEFASVALPNLNANNIDSGTLSDDRIPNFTGSQGASLKLVDKATVTTNVANIQFTGIEDDTMYKIIGKHAYNSSNNLIQMDLQDSNSSALGVYYNRWYTNNPTHSSLHDYRQAAYAISIYTSAFVIDFSNAVDNSWLLGWGISAGLSIPMKNEFYATLQSTTERVHNIKFSVGASDFTSPTQILLYKYLES